MTIGVIDDHDLFREGITAILSRHPDLDVIAQGSTSADATMIAEKLAPDVLLLDAELNGDPAPTTIRRVRRLAPSTRIVILTMHRDSILRKELLHAGATAYVVKSVPSVDLVSLLRQLGASSGRPELSKPPLIREQTRNDRLLTDRELQVIYQLANAGSNREIANVLAITEGTVKRHTSSIYLKLGVKSRMQAVQKAALLGIFTALEILGGLNRKLSWNVVASASHARETLELLEAGMPSDVAGVLLPRARKAVEALEGLPNGFFDSSRIEADQIRVPDGKGADRLIPKAAAATQWLRVIRNSQHGFDTTPSKRERELLAMHNGEIDPALPDLAWLYLLRLMTFPELLRAPNVKPN